VHSAKLLSVNVGTPRPATWAGIGRTSIAKETVSGAVAVSELGLAGDEVSDTKHHGGRDQAVYAFAREDLDWWEEELGQPIANGQFGENLTTVGIDVNAAEVGERWRIGSALFEVASVRIPCNDFKNWMGQSGFEKRAWVKRFTAVGKPGPYLRVVTEGSCRVGDTVDVVHRPGHGITVTSMFRALTTEPDLLPELLKVDGLVSQARSRAEKYLNSPR
jgi:MOSC domain-containing protein YiiM